MQSIFGLIKKNYKKGTYGERCFFRTPNNSRLKNSFLGILVAGLIFVFISAMKETGNWEGNPLFFFFLTNLKSTDKEDRRNLIFASNICRYSLSQGPSHAAPMR